MAAGSRVHLKNHALVLCVDKLDAKVVVGTVGRVEGSVPLKPSLLTGAVDRMVGEGRHLAEQLRADCELLCPSQM